MIKFLIGQPFQPVEVTASPDRTIRQLYRENNIPLTGDSFCSHNSGRVFKGPDLDKPIRDLGITDGDLVAISTKLASNN